MTLQYEIHKYGLLCSSYIITNLLQNEKEKIKSVIFFGSAAQMRAFEESDIDLFFDTSASKKNCTHLRSKINKIIGKWKLTQTALEFKVKKIENEINIIVGNLEEWDDLKRSIASNSVVLYGKYQAKPFTKKLYNIVSWENTEKSRGAVFNSIYGYKSAGKRYKGLLQKNEGVKLGKSTIMIPSEQRQKITDVFEKYGIGYSIHEVWK